MKKENKKFPSWVLVAFIIMTLVLWILFKTSLTLIEDVNNLETQFERQESIQDSRYETAREHRIESRSIKYQLEVVKDSLGYIDPDCSPYGCRNDEEPWLLHWEELLKELNLQWEYATTTPGKYILIE